MLIKYVGNITYIDSARTIITRWWLVMQSTSEYPLVGIVLMIHFILRAINENVSADTAFFV